jgi:tetratricopeptide (TPR) repeat protein
VVEGSRFRWEAETAGLVTLLVEAALGELDGCLVSVAGRPGSPGVLAPVGLAAAPTWRTRLTLGPDPHDLTVALEICSAGGEGDVPCTSVTGTGTREDPQGAIPPLVALVSRIVDRAPAPGASAQWSLPISADPYAVLVAGRAAASWYGLLPAPSREIEGDNRRDPLARAVYIDPSMPLSQWLVGRRSALAGRWDDARPSFTAARQGRPFHPVLVADEAEALVAEERPLPAAEAWEGLMQAVPDDPRFRLPHALAVLRAGRVDPARELLDHLAADWPDDPGVSAARVAVADAAGEDADLDRLLANWQDNDVTAVEPVRRRIQLRVRGSRWREAWELLPELRHRDAHALADGLALSLGSLVGEAEEAARAAERVGRPDVAARLRARAAIAAHRPLDELPPIDDVDGFVAAGHAALDQGLPEEAEVYAGRASRQRPWDPDVLALVAATARARGDLDAAARAEARRRAVEPAVQPSMVTAPAIR